MGAAPRTPGGAVLGETVLRLDEMNQLLASAVTRRQLPSEVVPVRRSHGRLLAADQASALDLPPFDKSAMDGYAILADDESESYRVLGTTAAGKAAEFALGIGTTVKVMTGAPVPAGSGRVVMQEHTEEIDGTVKLLKRGAAVNICRQGEDVRRGEVILGAGARLGALEVANLIACGVTEVEVVRPARLAIISTGDEIVESPAELAPGKIIDTNTPLLEALARDFGLEVVSLARVADDQGATARAIRAAVESADIVVLSGGISVGEFDYVHDALADLGIVELFSGVAIKPGRPLTCARAASGVFVVALPGNPVSVHLMFHLCVLRLVALLSGASPQLREVELELGTRFSRRVTERQEYVPARLSESGTVVPVEFHGSAHLTALTEADGYLVVPIGPSELPAGSKVRFLPLLLHSAGKGLQR